MPDALTPKKTVAIFGAGPVGLAQRLRPGVAADQGGDGSG